MSNTGRALLVRLWLLGSAIVLTVLALFGLVLFTLTLAGIATIIIWTGLALAAIGIMLTRPYADLHRTWAGQLLGVPVARPYRPRDGEGIFNWVKVTATDPATWRDLLWLLINGTIGLTVAIIGVVLGVLDLLFFWWLPKRSILEINARIVYWLLGPTDQGKLALRVQQLSESRAQTIDTHAAELRRIERDLHDGAQARLVALGMNLGMAEELVHTNPEDAKRLLAEARTNSTEALSELRDLVRGIHPPVLADRGLAGGLEALALSCPVPVHTDVDVPVRLEAPVESAAYFATAEVLTNVAKHSGATQAWIQARYRDGRLSIMVADDGVGGADPARGSGLSGIERRLAAFDGTIFVTSPLGGPTIVSLELPCASSSQRTLPSSGTA